ncbi:hypothetical protein A2477_04810 [Candidatus Falkowbacteria bacterium RIFOXYC2_FULL_47_12]|uniref:Glycosyltransferase RgtA/B/C/D-like domain-containing protein n=2 Tax=Candidatus Falkowiibacteriota TaxID=1752728 RepID=A0A1F5TML8_9BACT|nr:MAG: hypothetical protein A2242_01525 [Candidatus Falkowbacteria bacterium RIFOXYA2_FULL_47_9]OGF40064.1 MAG: hypothetical protein A2477_04810 [Candidatus Falkowbacteria bacterium RIFOXYC2_FULL_47_12]
MEKAYFNFLLILALVSGYGAFIYRLYKLDYLAVILTLFLVVITFILLKKAVFSKETPFDISKYQISNIPASPADRQYPIFLVVYYFLLLTFNFFILFQSKATESIISPWQVVPWYFWLTFTVSTILLIAITLKNSLPRFLYFLLLTSYFLLCSSIAVIIYAIGFGFDPFIHQATEKLIDAAGAVEPKPWYYLGQYALIVILHKLTFIPIVWLDKLLVPVLAALTLPYALYQAAKSFTADERVAKLTTLFVLIFPFATFIVTTPQNLANLFLILVILLSLNKINSDAPQRIFTSYFFLFTLSFAALAIHPIAGIPAVLFAALTAARQYLTNKKILLTSYFLLLTLAALSLPLAFYLNNQSNSIINAAGDTTAKISWHWPQLFFSDTGNFLLNFVYLYGFNIALIIILFIFSGIFIRYKKNQISNSYLLMSLSLLISYLLTKTISFSYLIDYERSNFSSRILIIAVYFVLPFILLALVRLIEKILQQELTVKYLFFCFLAFLLSCSLYFSYPRYDDYYNSRSFSTSQANVDAVNWINQDAGDGNFIVLANQQVSAAALREFGFKKYFPSPRRSAPSPLPGGEGAGGEGGEVFYYPIPTGEKLYQYYLDMVNKNAERATALQAADLVGADTVYFVINNYWFGFEKILAEARIGADVAQSIYNGQIYIFKYRK